jgi:hypothetical protein
MRRALVVLAVVLAVVGAFAAGALIFRDGDAQTHTVTGTVDTRRIRSGPSDTLPCEQPGDITIEDGSGATIDYQSPARRSRVHLHLLVQVHQRPGA